MKVRNQLLNYPPILLKVEQVVVRLNKCIQWEVQSGKCSKQVYFEYCVMCLKNSTKKFINYELSITITLIIKFSNFPTNLQQEQFVHYFICFFIILLCASNLTFLKYIENGRHDVCVRIYICFFFILCNLILFCCIFYNSSSNNIPSVSRRVCLFFRWNVLK